ncbi:GntR family transcriptional regulator [Cellulomonas hominis]|uniref:GntR family transcriptional regulator n=1 Tax=Cellulomonas hominis TaxID=156981 RepID=A0A511FB32_9CELL|nr:GntR family transcriptional regulator [Cellulomonas hominis]MBB5471634.1 GntR family transcriptional regulator [Cellulomonas hominis]NKY07242.1 GntR family transcriptional regulator [Cellulomonas hominis]GEL46423.1 GntR family transcriptional regulator [Cellulomonas hominis]
MHAEQPRTAPPTATGRSGHKYQAVRSYLIDLVERTLDVGDAIPSERALCERFGVSRMTVRQAVDALVGEGVLVREQGRGTFVAPQRMDFEMRLTTFGEEMRRRGMRPDTRVLDARTEPAFGEAADALGTDVDAPLHHLWRVRYADGTPISIEQLWVPVALAPDLFTGGPPPSLYDALREAGYEPSWGEETLTASEATDEEARLLDLRGTRAVLRATRRTFAADGPCMYSRACYRGDRYSVWVPLSAPGPALVPRVRAEDAAAKVGAQ